MKKPHNAAVGMGVVGFFLPVIWIQARVPEFGNWLSMPNRAPVEYEEIAPYIFSVTAAVLALICSLIFHRRAIKLDTSKNPVVTGGRGLVRLR
jgi:hypothetical protein